MSGDEDEGDSSSTSSLSHRRRDGQGDPRRHRADDQPDAVLLDQFLGDLPAPLGDGRVVFVNEDDLAAAFQSTLRC